jgi:uncharacterized protein YqeY
VLRFLISEIKNREIDAKHELTDDEVIELLRRETKRRTEAIAQYTAGGRVDIVETEKQELAVIEVYLPQLMDAGAVEAIVDQVVTANPGADFGQVMRAAMAQLKGQADGKMVSEAVKKKLG